MICYARRSSARDASSAPGCGSRKEKTVTEQLNPDRALQVAHTTDAITQAFAPKNFNLLQLPTVVAEQDGHEIVVAQVRIDPNDKTMVYPSPQQRGQFCLHSLALKLLGSAAGVQFSRSEVTFDRNNSPTVSMVGRWQDAPGHWRTVPGTYKLDIPARLAELKLDAERQSDKDKRKRALANLPTLQLRVKRFAVQLAETGAMLRVLRTLLNIRQSYTPAELRRPFIVLRVHWRPQSAELVEAQRVVARADTADLFGDTGDRPSEAVLRLARALVKLASGEPPAWQDAATPAIEAEAKALRGDDVEEAQAAADRDGAPGQHWFDDPGTKARFEAWMASHSLDMSTICALLEIEDIDDYTFSKEQFLEDVDAALAVAIEAATTTVEG